MTEAPFEIISKHQGIAIKKDEQGYFWDCGPSSGGYFDSVEEAAADIEDYWRSSADDDVNPHEDTPSLDAPWWSIP